MINFTKIVLPKITVTISKGRLVNEHRGRFANLAYYTVENLDSIPTIPFKITPQRLTYGVISGNGTLGAHRDYGATTCLNYYIASANAVTNFFDPKNISEPRKNIYSTQEIIYVESFVAEVGDYYLLNVDTIHNVVLPTDGVRCFLSWQWNLPYSEVLNSLM